MFEDLKDGIGAYFLAWQHIRKHKLWGYVLLPGLFALIYGASMAYFTILMADNFGDMVGSKYPWEVGLTIATKFASVLGAAVTATFAFLTFKYVVLIVVSPFMSPLSESVEKSMRGEEYIKVPFSIKTAFKDIGRSIKISLRNFIHESVIYLLIMALSFFPVINLLSAVIYLIFQAYYAGFGNMDYTLERHMTVRETASFVKRFPGLAIANGGIFIFLIFMVPVVGVFFAPALATTAATIETVRRLDELNPTHDIINNTEFI